MIFSNVRTAICSCDVGHVMTTCDILQVRRVTLNSVQTYAILNTST